MQVSARRRRLRADTAADPSVISVGMSGSSWITLPIALPVILCAAGCERDPSQTIEQADKTLHTGASSLGLTSKQLDDSARTRKYTTVLAAAARQQLHDQAESLREVPETDPRRGELEEGMLLLRQRWDALRDRAATGGQ
jgi:hypothetical protein